MERVLNYRMRVFAAAFAMAMAVAGTVAHAGDKALRLRVSDASGRPDGGVVFVLRTYAPRGIGQGQVCIRRRGRGKRLRTGARALGRAQTTTEALTIQRAVAFAEEGDGVATAVADENDPELIVVSFRSPSGTINQAEGLMVAVFLQVGSDALPGTRYDLEIDLANSFLEDPKGQRIPIEPRSGELIVLDPGARYQLQPEGDRVFAGETARLGVESTEPRGLSSGRVALRFDPNLLGGAPVVRMDGRHGRSAFLVNSPEPGLLVLSFDSPDGSLNDVPGELIAIEFPTSASAGAGVFPLTLDPALTFLIDAGGGLIDLELEAGTLELQ